MITAPENWNTLWDDPETKMRILLEVDVAGLNITKQYTEDDLLNCTLEAALWSELSIGNVTSACLSFTIAGGATEQSLFLKESRIDFSVCLEKDGTVTDYVKQGVFYVNDANVSNDNDLSVTAYDMLHFFADSKLVIQVESTGFITASEAILMCVSLGSIYGNLAFTQSEWNTLWSGFLNTSVNGLYPQSNSSSATKIIGNIGVPVEMMNSDRPFSELVGSIAAIAGGNAYIGKDNAAKFAPLKIGYSITQSYAQARVVTASSISTNKVFDSVIPHVYFDTKSSNVRNGMYGYCVEAHISDKFPMRQDTTLPRYDVTQINSNITHSISIQHPGASWSAIADIEASGVYVSPLMELLDSVYIPLDGKFYEMFYLSEMRLDYCEGCWGNLGQSASEGSVFFVNNDYITWSKDNNFIFRFGDTTASRPTYFAVGGSRLIALTFSGRVPSSTYASRTFRLGSNSSAKSFQITITYSVSGISYTFTTTAYQVNPIVQMFKGVSTYADLCVYYALADDLPDEIVNKTATSIRVENTFTTKSGVTGIFFDLERDVTPTNSFRPDSNPYVDNIDVPITSTNISSSSDLSGYKSNDVVEVSAIPIALSSALNNGANRKVATVVSWGVPNKQIYFPVFTENGLVGYGWILTNGEVYVKNTSGSQLASGTQLYFSAIYIAVKN